MKKILALIWARNKEFYRDRTALIWSLVFPFIVLAGFRYGYAGNQDPLVRVRVTPAALASAPAIVALRETPGLELVATDDAAKARQLLEHYEADLLIGGEPSRLTYSYNPDSDRGKLGERLLSQANRQQVEPAGLESQPASGSRLRYSDWLLPGLLAMNIMFGAMFGVGYVIVRYRKNGVLKRLRATPLNAFQFLGAQVISRMLLLLLTSYLVLGGAVVLIGFHPRGSLIDLTLFLAVGASAMISLGMVVAARISSEEVADGVLNLMTWPMIFLSGIWFSLDGATK